LRIFIKILQANCRYALKEKTIVPTIICKSLVQVYARHKKVNVAGFVACILSDHVTIALHAITTTVFHHCALEHQSHIFSLWRILLFLKSLKDASRG
jgi:hypothetical protein